MSLKIGNNEYPLTTTKPNVPSNLDNDYMIGEEYWSETTNLWKTSSTTSSLTPIGG